jgi:AcrR family transcriptional regulator
MAATGASAARDTADLGVDLTNPTIRRILVGAIKGLSGQAAHKLSMSDIADMAGVSRGTLYRYFQTKTDVIRAANEYISTTFEHSVKRVASMESTPLDVLEAVLAYHFTYANAENYTRILEVEPALVVQFFNDHFERHKTAISTALEPTFAHLDEALGTKVDRDLVAEVLIRMEISTVLVPAGQGWNKLPDLAPKLVELLVSLARPR